jgi:hypothetical protein
MLKNKIAFKRIRNVIFLGLIIVIMLGVYHNSIRSSRAENTAQIEIEFVDVDGNLDSVVVSNFVVTKNEVQDETTGEVSIDSYTIPQSIFHQYPHA